MFENIINFFKKMKGEQKKESKTPKDAAKERLQLVLMQDRANVSADFLDMMKQEIIEVIKKYIDVEENEIDVRLTNKQNEDGTSGAPALFANIPIKTIKHDVVDNVPEKEKNTNKNEKNEDNKENKEVKESKKVEEEKTEKQEKQEIEKDEEIKEDKKQQENEEPIKEDDTDKKSEKDETKKKEETKQEIKQEEKVEDNKKEESEKSDEKEAKKEASTT